MWDLWSKSNADTREKWRDIANVVRDVSDRERPDQLAEYLQMAFFFGAVSGSSGRGTHGEVGLRALLPGSTVGAIMGGPQLVGKTGRRGMRGGSKHG
jgi:hypothetical protein